MHLRSACTSLLALLSFSTAVVSQTVQTPLGVAVSGRFIVSYRNGAIPAAPRTAGAILVQRHERLGIAILQTSPSSATATRSQLNADPAVESVVEDRVVTAHALSVRAAAAAPATSVSSADALYNGPQGWAVRAVGGFGSSTVPGPWSATTGAGVRIAILDSGVDAAHPDIAPNLALNLSEIDQSAATGLPSPCDDGSASDQQGHGTWSASLAAAALGAATGQVAGVAPSATIFNIKVIERLPAVPTAADPTGCAAGQASGLLSWVIQGIEDAVANRADIISMSLGAMVDITTGDGAGLQATFNHVTHAASQAGVILIAAAGNDGFNYANQRYVELPAMARDVLAIVASTNPACAENLITGAACTSAPPTLPYYSNYGVPMNALAAPGGNLPGSPDTTQSSGWIVGACSSGKPSTLDGAPTDSAHSLGCFDLGHTPYAEAMGTSASAPLVAGAAALLRAANPTWSAATVVAALRSSARPFATLPVPLVDVTALVTPTRPSTQTSHHVTASNRQ